MEGIRKIILLITHLYFFSVVWGQSYNDNFTQEIINISDEKIMIISNYEMKNEIVSDTSYIYVSRLVPPCDDGYIEIDGECYYQSDLDVLQEFIANSIDTIDMSMDENENGIIEPLELGNQDWNEGRLIHLICNSSGLSRNIPENIDDLTYLAVLHLTYNDLMDNIPSGMGNLSYLWSLFLSGNELTGEIPDGLWNLNLGYFVIAFNNLAGTLPVDIGFTSSIVVLHFGGNEFSGEIPNLIEMINLNQLWLSDNNFSGQINESICEIVPNLNTFDISYNNLCPPYPDCLTEEDIGYQNTTECVDCPDSIEGDVNGDGEVNVLDIVLISYCIIGDYCDQCSDLNLDGSIDILDIIIMINLTLYP